MRTTTCSGVWDQFTGEHHRLKIKGISGEQATMLAGNLIQKHNEGAKVTTSFSKISV